jgi:hypothetical protein
MLLIKLPSLESLFIIATESITNIVEIVHNLIVFGQAMWIIQGLRVIHYIRRAMELMERYKLVVERQLIVEIPNDRLGPLYS